MKIDNIKRIAREEIEEAPEWIDQLLDPLNNALEQFTQTFRNQVDLANNAYVRIVTQTFTDGVEVIIKNPFDKGTKPIGICPIATESDYSIDGFHYQYQTNGELGVTMNFSIPKSYIFLTRNADQMVANVTDTAIIWTTAQNNEGFIWSSTTNPTRIITPIAGRYVFSYDLPWAANATGNRAGWISKNGVITGTASRFGNYNLPNNGAGLILEGTGTATINMAANDYVEVYGYQASLGNLNAFGNGSAEVKITGHSLSYSGYSAKVTFIVFGG